MAAKENTIQRKLVKSVLSICGAVLLLACTTILTYEFVTFRESTIQQASSLGQIIAANSTAALAFDNAKDATEILSALKVEQFVVGAGLYTKDGRLFSHYPSSLPESEFPAKPGEDDYRSAGSSLFGFQAVVQENKRLGTLYLKWDLGPAYLRFLFYGFFIIVIMAACLLAAAYLLSRILRRRISHPILELSKTARAVSARQDYSVRANRTSEDDELSLLTDVFNKMLDRIQAQNTESKQAESKLQTQLSRMQLLERITRATAERQDLQSIFQVVVGSLEGDLPIDFGCVCLYEPAEKALTVMCIGTKSEPLAVKLNMTPQSPLPIDENGLSICMRGRLLYEPQTGNVAFPFPQQLASHGLNSFVAAPLPVENRVFGVLIAARRAPEAFSSPDCEFIRHLSEHVALSAHQANLYSDLQGAYEDLRHTQQSVMQQERLRALGQMASGIAHDINNAISPIALYTESLLEREPNLSTRARGYLEITRHAIEDVAHTIARMREFYREREGQLALLPMHLNNLVQQVKDLTHARWSDMPLQRGIVIEFADDLAPSLPAVSGIESEIREALVNLIFNAVDAMPDGGTLTVRTYATDKSGSTGFVHLEVSDTGTGMDEETKRRCLEPFFTTKGERGTGLGMAMVYGVVQRNNAEIRIESELGKGTTVHLIFPVPDPNATTNALPSSVEPGQPLRILIVDDDPLLIRALRETLEADGHFVTSAPGGQQGIEAFEMAHRSRETFGLVITDLGMPYVDGRTVSAAVKAVSPTTPVILFTGWGERLVADRDIPQHVDRVLNKPPKLQDLRAALAELTAVHQEHNA